MLTAATLPRELAGKYVQVCEELASRETDEARIVELRQMALNLRRVPWEPAETFWEAVQALWLTHMLVMSDENYPGPGVSFGRIDQYLYPYWQRSLAAGMDREFGKEILKCFWVHANTAYDAMIRTGGNQGITAGFGQLLTLSGMGAGGRDMTNDLTYAILEVIDEMSPILEPKPNVRLHRGTPDALLDKVVAMIASSQGAPFLLNFDERSMAGMLLEARRAGSREPDPPRQRARVRAGRLPGEYHVRQRPLGHGGLQPEPAQGGRAGADRRLRPDPLHRPDDRQDRSAHAFWGRHRRCDHLHDLGAVLGGLRGADPLHRQADRGPV